jgi:hypothetical protein
MIGTLKERADDAVWTTEDLIDWFGDLIPSHEHAAAMMLEVRDRIPRFASVGISYRMRMIRELMQSELGFENIPAIVTYRRKK